jgi:hypothetical protein
MRRHTFVLILAFVACLAQGERAAAQEESASATVPTGSKTYRLVLKVAEPPAPRDFMYSKVSTAAVTTTLILPNGRKITGENAEAEGLGWSQGFDGPAPIGSEDYGQFIKITFRKPAPAGRYTFEFAFQQLREPARVKAAFTSRMADYRQLLRATPGAQLSKEVPFSPTATVTFDLPEEEEEAWLDVVVPDASTEVVLVLPDGRKLRRDDAKNADINWETQTKPQESFLDEFSLPLEGTHQIIGFKRAAKGRYEVHASSKTATKGEMRVAFVPLKAFATASAARMMAMELETGEISSSGGIHIRPQHLPFECFVGDSLPVEFELVGDVGPQPPQFEVREDRRAWLRDTDVGVQLAPTEPAEVLPVQLSKVGPQTYKGTVVPAKPGWVRISVKATGKTASGQPFSTETLLTNSDMIVRPIAARFVGITAKAVAPEGSSKFDRLEVTATLDVLIPGDYSMGFGIRDAAGARPEGPGFSGHATLEAGRQTLTASVPSSQIWRDLRDGPFEIIGIAINRTQKATLSWIKVPTGDATFRTPAYRHDQWDPGQVYGEDHVTVHGIYPAASGRFRLAEVEWEVTTPGLFCSWTGAMRGDFLPPYTSGKVQPAMDARGQATLPAGKTKLSFLFDGATIHSFGKQNWKFFAGLNCGETENSIGRNPPFGWTLTPRPKIDLNPDDYEPAFGSFSVQPAPIALRLSPGGSGDSRVWVKDKKDVRFAVGDVPKGMEAKLTEPQESQGYTSSSLRITTSPETASGRYLLGLTATSGEEAVTGMVVVDVVPK